jgi:hypothetical protein
MTMDQDKKSQNGLEIRKGYEVRRPLVNLNMECNDVILLALKSSPRKP